MKALRAILLTAILPGIILGQALAVDPDEILDDPALEARARELSRELRCITCQSQSIDDSDAPLAKDLRLIVRERLVAGDTDREILTFMTDRYGDYVLLKPELRSDTAILWFAPLIVFGAAMGGAIFYFRKTQKNSLGESKVLDYQDTEDPCSEYAYKEDLDTDNVYSEYPYKEDNNKNNPAT